MPKPAIPVLPVLVAQRAATMPDRAFLHDVDSPHPLTYGDTQARVRCWISFLRTRGIGAGDVVATMLETTGEAVAIWLALAWLGAIDCGLNLDQRVDLLAHSLDSVDARWLVTDEQRAAEWADEPIVAARGIELLSTAMVDLRDALPPSDLRPPEAGDVACIVFTSGTTGRSKPVIVHWAQLYAVATGMYPLPRLRSDDKAYVARPMAHVSARMSVLTAALLGTCAVLRGRFSAAAFWADVERHNCTLTVLMGTRLLLAAATEQRVRTTPLRLCVMAPVVPGWAEFAERFEVELITAYGGSELCLPIHGVVVAETWMSCGRAREGWPDVDLRIVDEAGSDVPDGMVGELLVRTGDPRSMAGGYFHDAAATAAAWRDGWYHTAELFSRDHDGNYYWRDRMSDSLRRRGENISSVEVEMAVRAHSAVVECAVVGVPSEIEGDDVRCFVILGDADVSPAQVRASLETLLPRYMLPRYIDVVEELPRTQTGRVAKRQLRDRPFTGATVDFESSGTARRRLT